MKTWRLVVVAVGLLGMAAACGGSKKDSASADDVGNEGCPDVDPFCKGGGGDDPEPADASDAPSDTPPADGPEAGGSKNPFVTGPTKSDAKAKEFDLLVQVQKGKEDKVGKVKLHPAGMGFGMSSEQIAKLYDRLFDKAYLELYKTTPIGPQTEALDAELSEKKAQLRRSRLEFGNLPTGIDNTPLKGEYSYGNNESMSRIDLENGIVRHFFFFNDRLWKIYDEHRVGAGKPLGADFAAAVKLVQDKIGAEPKKLEPDFARGKLFEAAEWSDGSTILRMLNREPIVAILFIEEGTEKKLSTLRKNRPSNPTAVDAAVRDATAPPPPPPKDPKKDPKKK